MINTLHYLPGRSGDSDLCSTVRTGFAGGILHEQRRYVLVHAGLVCGYAGVGAGVLEVHVADVNLASVCCEERQRTWVSSSAPVAAVMSAR